MVISFSPKIREKEIINKLRKNKKIFHRKTKKQGRGSGVKNISAFIRGRFLADYLFRGLKTSFIIVIGKCIGHRWLIKVR